MIAKKLNRARLDVKCTIKNNSKTTIVVKSLV